jgi:hypothetical protein
MKCWICGREGNTREHLIKASDLRSCFGDISQRNPIYFNTSDNKNIPVGSLKSKRLKFDVFICNPCNSALTQPNDRAWESLSDYLRTNWSKLLGSRRLNLAKVFPGSVHKSMLNVHLYFVKLFGCEIAESGAPIDIAGFSQALLNQQAHQDIFIAFGPPPGGVQQKSASISTMLTLDFNAVPTCASWFYVVDQLAVNIIYVSDYGDPDLMKDTWHPDNLSKVVKIKSF